MNKHRIFGDNNDFYFIYVSSNKQKSKSIVFWFFSLVNIPIFSSSVRYLATWDQMVTIFNDKKQFENEVTNSIGELSELAILRELNKKVKIMNRLNFIYTKSFIILNSAFWIGLVFLISTMIGWDRPSKYIYYVVPMLVLAFIPEILVPFVDQKTRTYFIYAMINLYREKNGKFSDDFSQIIFEPKGTQTVNKFTPGYSNMFKNIRRRAYSYQIILNVDEWYNIKIYPLKPSAISYLPSFLAVWIYSTLNQKARKYFCKEFYRKVNLSKFKEILNKAE